MSPPDGESAHRKDDATEDEIELAAADWIARSNGGPLTAEEEQRLNAWLARDPRHAAALASMRAAWSALNEPREKGRAGVLSIDLNRRLRQRRRRRYVWTAATLAAAAALAFLLPLNRPSHSPGAGSIVVHPDARLLPDGSTVVLNVGAEVTEDFSAERRDVVLNRGEAIFVIKPDPARPFVVLAGRIAVRAVGTTFAVRHEPGQVNVLVTEGKVAVERRDDPPVAGTAPRARSDVVYLERGKQALVPTAMSDPSPVEIRNVSAADAAAALAWRERRVEFNATPFQEAIDLYNRQNELQFVLADADLARRRITGVFWADDPEGFVRLVEAGFGVKATRSGKTITLRGK